MTVSTRSCQPAASAPPCKLHALVEMITKCTKLLWPLMMLPLLPLMLLLLLTAS